MMRNRENIIKWDDDKISKVWEKILQHKFFKAFHKDLYIEDLLTEIANTIYIMELKINSLEKKENVKNEGKDD